MSFITKRERVFDQYDLCDLPPRNEGKLKAYSSCTDARAWSHFCSDKTEHLVELIKRNNEVQPGKFIPLNVIVDLMMASKNGEIRRLKRKLEHFEQLLAVYDQLELTPEQKCEIQSAHAMIKAANKELEEVEFNLDISGYTEGIDSEDFATGKSRGDVIYSGRRFSEMPVIRSRETSKSGGDEWMSDIESIHEKVSEQFPKAEIRSFSEAGTYALDPRISEMQEALIHKDAKLSALQNTIAVMENDVCEPYCIYAHIYTALEKIFATLRQNDKYKLYLDLVLAGKDIRSIDIKGKILFKLKVLEKFCVALIAPCNERFAPETCECYRAEIAHVETTFALTSSEPFEGGIDSKRAHLVADIMHHDEMMDLLERDPSTTKPGESQNYGIETDNLTRLKNLQANYDELMTCYENMKFDRDTLSLRCQQYEEMERECNDLREQLREYNILYDEREHYRKRSEDLDNLKKEFLMLSDETVGLETQLKAEIEINSIKSNTIEELRNDNIELEKRLNEAAIAFEKDKNALQCKLKETECKVMCQEQQIRSLSTQMERLLEQQPEKQYEDTSSKTVAFLDEIQSLKEEIKFLKNLLGTSEEEKQQLQDKFREQLQTINELKSEVEKWKGTCEETEKRNTYLEEYTENFRDDVHKLMVENANLNIELETKTTAVANLINVLNSKTQEVISLKEEIEQRNIETTELFTKLSLTNQVFDQTVSKLESEKENVLSSLQLSRRESQDLIQKVRHYENKTETQSQDYSKVKEMLMDTIEENEKLQMQLVDQENNNECLLKELQQLKAEHQYAIDNISDLQEENQAHKLNFENQRKELDALKQAYEKLLVEKHKLECELDIRTFDLNDSMQKIELTKKESEKLLDKIQQSEKLKDDIETLSADYQRLVGENQNLLKELDDKNNFIHSLLQTLNKLKEENEELQGKVNDLSSLEKVLADSKKAFDELQAEKQMLQTDFDNKTKEIDNLYNTLEIKIEENKDLMNQVKLLESQQKEVKHSINALENENIIAQTTLTAVRRESQALFEKLKQYDTLANEYDQLKKAYNEIQREKEHLMEETNKQLKELSRLEAENREYIKTNEDLERALITARAELAIKSDELAIYSDIKKEVDGIKAEKLHNHDKMKDLLNRLDESENIITNLSEELMTRDDRITTLQNYNNSLKDEIRKLQSDLADVVKAGEGIKNIGYQKIDESINKLEAHHSKATHNMKMEIAKLQNTKAQLEEELSRASDESMKLKQSNSLRILNLQRERAYIVDGIRKLERSSAGKSTLMPDQSNLDDIEMSLDSIQKYIDAKKSLCSSLEQKLQKVQSSSQLLQSKTDEAKRLVEKERQKIVSEKEEAIAEKLNMEKQLLDLKHKLQRQTDDDKKIIKDLEAEILNQKLIIAKIDDSTSKYITKLEDEIQTVQNMYKNSMDEIKDLQDQIENLTEEKATNAELLERLNADLKEKSNELSILQEELNTIKNTQKTDTQNQTDIYSSFVNQSTQTNKMFDDSFYEKSAVEIDIVKTKDTRPKRIPQSLNEVQILTANVELTTEINDSYLTHKLNQLSIGRLELLEYCVPSESESKENNCDLARQESQNSDEIEHSLTARKFVIYDKQSDTQSSKGTVSPKKTVSELDPGNARASSSKKLEDIFLIYNDSETSSVDKRPDGSWSQGRQSDVMVGSALTLTMLNENLPLNITIPRLSEIDEALLQDFNEIETKIKNGAQNEKHMEDATDPTSKKKSPRNYEVKFTSNKTLQDTDPKRTKRLDSDVIQKESEKYRKDTIPIDVNIDNNEVDKNINKAAIKSNQSSHQRSFYEEPNELNKNSKNDMNSDFDINDNKNSEGSSSEEIQPDRDPATYSFISSATIRNRNNDIINQKLIPALNLIFKDEDSEATDTINNYVRSSEYQKQFRNNSIALKKEPEKDIMPVIEENNRKIYQRYTEAPRIPKKLDENHLIEQEKRSPENHTSPKSDASKLAAMDHKKRDEIEYTKDHRNVMSEQEDVNNVRSNGPTPGNMNYELSAFISQSLDRTAKLCAEDNSRHNLSRVGADVLIFKNENAGNVSPQKIDNGNFGLEYILNTMKNEFEPEHLQSLPPYEALSNYVRKSRSEDIYHTFRDSGVSDSSPGLSAGKITSACPSNRSPAKSVTVRSVEVNSDPIENYETKIKSLMSALASIEKDYKRKIEALKLQYDCHIKSIINDHNQGVKSIQNLHEETLHDIIKIHENEVENLRTMSIDAMRKAEKLEKENKLLRSKLDPLKSLDEEPERICSGEPKKKKRHRGDTRMLTKTNVEAFNVKPKIKSPGPCTCSLDVNVSDTIRNIFEQVDVEQRKIAEHAYLKYIANKLLSHNIESLDSQELSFLHLKVCRSWKSKLNKEELLQKRIDTLENELMSKQRHAQQHIAELDRKVAEERRRLQEVREAVCRGPEEHAAECSSSHVHINAVLGRDCGCACNKMDIGERRSAGDLAPGRSGVSPVRPRRPRPQERAVLAKLDVEERREKKIFDEAPTRLRRAHDRAPLRKK